jgi:IS30 family transposase
MPPALFGPLAKPPSGRYLSFAEREEIALLRAQGCNVREVARRIGRAASTISRELRRNAAVPVWNIARQQRSGMPSDQPVDQNRHGLG